MAAVLLGLTSLAVVDRASQPVEDAAGRALAPLQGVLYGTGARIQRIGSGARAMAELQARVTELEATNSQLAVENLKTRDLARENDALRDQLAFAHQRVDLDLTGASVVGRKVAEEPGNLMHTVKIDAGSRDGVRVGMPVANDRGLIGRIGRAGPSWSDVLLITDPGSAVQARIERTRETGVVFGTTGGELRMRFIPQDMEGEPNVKVGDVVFTSGLSQEFPRMIPIGQVVAVNQSDVEPHQEAVIHPTVDFSTLELVLVVQGEHSREPTGGP
jgi:rod shape-determining protein MreC